MNNLIEVGGNGSESTTRPDSKSGSGHSLDDHTTSVKSNESMIAPLLGAVVLGIQNKFSDFRSPSDLRDSSTVISCNSDERQERVRYLYSKLVNDLSVLARGDLQPGQRREALGFLHDASSAYPRDFPDAFEKILYTESRKISDRAKATAVRFCSDLADISDKPRYVALLISQLRSKSPSQASAAAVCLSEIADTFSIPAISAMREYITWPSVKKDIDETISEIVAE